MLDALDLNSMAKARQINLQFNITAHMKFYESSKNFIFHYLSCAFCVAVYLILYIATIVILFGP